MSFKDQVMKTFGQKLKAARKKAGYRSAKAFADAIGVEDPRYRTWERGAVSPPLHMLTRMCVLLDVEPNDLLPLARRDRGNAKPKTNSNPSTAAA
jgi:transcriptional regulator with XRE-family HTH domain